MGTRPDDGAISAGKGAMGGVGLGEPSKSAPLDGGNRVLAPPRGFATTFQSLKLVLMTGLLLMRGCPSKGLADGGRLERALMTGRAAFGCSGA